MNRYVVLCDCDSICSGEARHPVAVIDDQRPDGPLLIAPNYLAAINLPPGGWVTTTTEPNHRGDSAAPLHLKCPHCERELPRRIRPSKVAAIVDMLWPWLKNQGTVDWYEFDVPETEADEALWRAQGMAEITGGVYSGHAPNMTPYFAARVVIPFALFLKAISTKPRDHL